MPRVGAAVLKARYIRGPMSARLPASNAFNVAGRVLMVPVDVPWPIIIDRIIYQVGATAAGNVRLGIYREGATADSPLGAALVVESASAAQGTANTTQVVTVTATILTPGQYFVGIQGSNTTGTYFGTNATEATLSPYYDRSGGYGTFTDPCPAVAESGAFPWLLLRVKENLPAGYRL